MKSSDLLAALPSNCSAQRLDHPAQAETVRRRLELAGLQFGEGEDAVDHAHHVAGGTGGGLLVLLQFRIQFDGLHQFQRTDHAVHRRAQFVGQGREEFVLELVAVGQLLVEHFELLPGVEQGLRLLLAHRVDAVGQRQRQQRHFDGRADLAGVHGQEHVRQQAQHHQRIDDAAEQKRRPGNDEITRHPQAAPPGQNPGGENHHGKRQRQQASPAAATGRNWSSATNPTTSALNAIRPISTRSSQRLWFFVCRKLRAN